MEIEDKKCLQQEEVFRKLDSFTKWNQISGCKYSYSVVLKVFHSSGFDPKCLQPTWATSSSLIEKDAKTAACMNIAFP